MPILEHFRLLETMKVSEEGNVLLLNRHLERLKASASHFGFGCDLSKLREVVDASIAREQRPARLRLLLSRDGRCDLEFGTLSNSDLPRRVQLSGFRIDSKDPFLYHKTTNRQVYEGAREGLAKGSEVILINERGEATETTIANIAVSRGGRWVTPPVSCGLLPGVMRAELLSTGELGEAVLPAGSLVVGETIRCFNAVRGVFDLPLRAFPPRPS